MKLLLYLALFISTPSSYALEFVKSGEVISASTINEAISDALKGYQVSGAALANSENLKSHQDFCDIAFSSEESSFYACKGAQLVGAYPLRGVSWKQTLEEQDLSSIWDN